MEAALAAARKAEAAAGGGGGGGGDAPPSPNVSNIPIPPSPGLSEKKEFPLPAVADLRIKVGDMTGPNTLGDGATPEQSPVKAKGPILPMVEKSNGLQVIVDDSPEAVRVVEQPLAGQKVEAIPEKGANEVPKAEVEKKEIKGQEAGKDAKEVEKAGEGKVEDADKKEDKKKEDGVLPRPKPTKEPKPEIGLHCWVIGATQDEVDDGAQACHELIDHAIQEYEDAFTDISSEEDVDMEDPQEEKEEKQEKGEKQAKVEDEKKVEVIEAAQELVAKA